VTDADDERFMRSALWLTERAQGQTWPNPAVGCVIVRDGVIVARGWTQPGGRPHAEAEALRRAGEAARGATAYVTLEPCANWGRTPPCSKALIEAGIARVVVGCLDPDPRVDGKGLAWLEREGVAVRLGVLEEAALFAHRGLYRRIQDGRPMVTLKLAQSVDGRIAARTGHSQWITGERARMEAHRLRATHDAILVGSGTVLADDPKLTCRLPGLGHRSPVRCILDRRLRTPAKAGLVQSAREVPVWLFTSSKSDEGQRHALMHEGVDVIALDEPGPEAVLTALGRRGIGRLMVEGGASVAGSLIRAGLVDRLHLCTAPLVIGGDGLAGIGDLGLDRVDQAPGWRRIDQRQLGPDLLQVFEAAS